MVGWDGTRNGLNVLTRHKTIIIIIIIIINVCFIRVPYSQKKTSRALNNKKLKATVSRSSDNAHIWHKQSGEAISFKGMRVLPGICTRKHRNT